MTECEKYILDLLNENESNNNTGVVVLEVKIPTPVDIQDYTKYSLELNKANDIIEDNHGKYQQETIVNTILNLIKFVLISFTGNALTKGISDVLLPKANPGGKFTDDLNVHIKYTTKEGSKKIIMFNPVSRIINFIINELIGKLFEIAVSPVRVHFMIKSYKNIIKELEKVKRTCRDENIEESCTKQIDRINKAIKRLESKIKEDSKMKTLKEIMEEIENGVTEGTVDNDIDVTIDEDALIESVDEAIKDIEEACKAKKEACKTKKEACSKSKKEEADVDDDEMEAEDLSPEDESTIDLTDEDDFDLL